MSSRLQSKHLEAREIAPWTEGEQTWRRLAVLFTKTVANHNTDQAFCCDDAHMQRRRDYSPDVTKKPPVPHHSTSTKHSTVVAFPTRQLVHLHEGRSVATQGFAPITIDLAAVTVDRI